MGRQPHRAARARRDRAIQATRQQHGRQDRERSALHGAAARRERRVEVDDIVLCRVKGNQYLHLVKAIQGERFQIGNNRGGINGWVTRRQIFGRLVKVEP